MHDLEMTEQVAWHENDGPSKSRGVKMQDMKTQHLKLQDLKWRTKLHDTKMQDPKIQHMNVHHLKLQDYFVVSVTDKFFMVKP